MRTFHCCLASFLLLLPPQSGSAANCWRELQFGASKGWLGASATVIYASQRAELSRGELIASPEGDALLPMGESTQQVHVDFAALRSKGALDIWHEPDSGQVLQTRRIGHGNNSRLKVQRFLRDGVWRQRHKGKPGNPEGWVLTSSQHLPYPPDTDRSTAILASVMLIERAAQLVQQRQTGASFLVFTDKQLYEVSLSVDEAAPMKVEFDLLDDGNEQHIKRTADVQRVSVQPRLLGKEPEDEPFKLLELSGDLAIYIDRETALPVRVQGSWFALGVIPVTLSLAKRDSDCGH